METFEIEKPKKRFICTGEPEIDSLRWYISTYTNGEVRLEGFIFGQNAMSMHLDCVLDPVQYMPDKLREEGLRTLNLSGSNNEKVQ